MPNPIPDSERHYICIGATKSATTWLHQRLGQQKDVYRLPLKEIRYFGGPRLPTLMGRSLRDQKRRLPRIIGHRAKRLHQTAARRDLAWLLYYAFGPRTDGWYRTLTRHPEGTLVGDSSPQYAIIPDADIAHAAALLPNAKILYLLRNPLDRHVSHVAMHFRTIRGHATPNWDDPWATKQFFSERLLAHGDYAANLARWESHFPSVHIEFYDDIRATPQSVLDATAKYLGIAPVKPDREAGTKRVYPGSYDSPPDAIKAKLAKLYIEKVEALHARLAHRHTRTWLEDLRNF